MFGYINPDRPHLFIKDETLYKALYCGMCKSIKQGCGNAARTALTYDMAFMSALLHNISNVDVKIKKKRCGLHLIKRRPMAEPDEMSIMLGCINTALAYYKLLDDKLDKDKKGVFAFLYKKGYRRTLKKHPKVADIIAEQMTDQRKLEEENCSIIDAACEPTAQMMKNLSTYALGKFATPHTEGLFYNIGKWIYLADALDDYDKDVKKGSYNVLYNNYKQPSRAEAVKAGDKELTFLFNSLFADMRLHLSQIKFYFNHDLTDNIIIMGIPQKTRTLFYGTDGEGKKDGKNEQTQS
jgi:hypothetical protein